jgi:hypothetical protein
MAVLSWRNMGAGMLSALSFFLPLLPGKAHAAPSVTYAPEQVGDHWQVDVTLNGPVTSGATLELEFAEALYDNLSVVSSGPEFNIENTLAAIAGSPGLLDATLGKSVSDAHEAHVLVSFTWLGGAATGPGSQPWYLLDAGFNQIAQGQTAPTVVPEPQAYLMLLCGLAVVTVARRRKPLS